jgi:hypothetical protein
LPNRQAVALRKCQLAGHKRAGLKTKNVLQQKSQATGNALISCIHAAHTKYELNPLDWQRVVEIGWRLLTKQDMEEDGLLEPGDYAIFKVWSAIAKSRDGYIRMRDRLVLGGEVQEMYNEENFYNKEPYKARVCAFFLGYHQVHAYCWWLLFRPTVLERYREFKVSLEWVMFFVCLLISFVLTDRNLTLVCATGKRERGSGPPVDHWSNGRAR